jgi:hypothetical protein
VSTAAHCEALVAYLRGDALTDAQRAMLAPGRKGEVISTRIVRVPFSLLQES